MSVKLCGLHCGLWERITSLKPSQMFAATKRLERGKSAPAQASVDGAFGFYFFVFHSFLGGGADILCRQDVQAAGQGSGRLNLPTGADGGPVPTHEGHS